MIKKIFIFFFVLSILCLAGLGSGLYYLVAVVPSEQIELESIKRILGKESNIYYSDGVTKIGVIFDKTHRQYVNYSEIPQYFVDALVSAEDNTFFTHFGFDPIGITRAMIKNIEAGRIVQGGSTLTQQTAKNLFKRKDRSIEEKLKELLFALRLEYKYSKEQIFEFYSNQFYVSGNGHGLGIAARYYFDKEPKDLTLVECAFIAGSVKRPNYYNPFTKKSPKSIDLAKERATTRLKYVLDKMLEGNKISQYEYSVSLQNGIPFKKGQFGFAYDSIMDMVSDAIDNEIIIKSLEKHNVSNISTSGVNIVTTIDKDIQAESLYQLRRQLSLLDTKIRGYNREEVQLELKDLNYTGDNRLDEHAFLFGTIKNIEIEKSDVKISVDLGIKSAVGIIEKDGLSRLIKANMNWHKGRWGKPAKTDTNLLVKELQIGDKVWVSVNSINDDETIDLNLEKYPQIQGASLVRHQGEIISAVGGTDNRDFNRSLYAKRTMGSAFKPLVFTAAMQLGWNSSDAIDNRRNVFVYQNMPYFPRPDHISPFDWVSMSWAGIKSENLASIWLLYHLTDKLNNDQLFDLASTLGFTRKVVDGQTEPVSSYRRRMRDKHGIVVNKTSIKEIAFNEAIKNLETDFIFEDLEDEYRQLSNLQYGHRFELFKERVQKSRKTQIASKARQNKRLTNKQLEEFKTREQILSASYLGIEKLIADFRIFKDTTWEEEDPFAISETPKQRFFGKEPFIYRSLQDGKMYFDYYLPKNKDYNILSKNEIINILNNRYFANNSKFWDSIILGGVMTSPVFKLVKQEYERQYSKLKNQNYYDFDTLSKINDFRVTVGLHYLINLAKEMGISSDLQPVLSFPLGSNVVTLLETVKMYETMVTGNTWKSIGDDQEESDSDMLGIIKRIESENGTVCYQSKTSKKIIVDKKTSLALGNILENTIKHGTGRNAKKQVSISSDNPETEQELEDLNLVVPLLGKTGTANDYTNAAFLGYLPGINEHNKNLSIDNGYTIGVYVGLDNNKPMKRKNIIISGAGGSLQPWSDIVNKIMTTRSYGDKLDMVDVSFEGLLLNRQNLGQKNLAMNMNDGGLLQQPIKETQASQPSILTFVKDESKQNLTPARYYQPFWKNQDSN